MSIVEVAKAAGVSHATVSRVINGRAGVSVEAVRKVREAMKKMDYTVPIHRRGPRTRAHCGIRTENIAVLLLSVDQNLLRAPVMAAALHGISAALNENRLNMVLAHVNDASQIPPLVVDGQVDGIIMEGLDPAADIIAKLQVFPCVWFMNKKTNPALYADDVYPDEAKIGQIAAEHLISVGHHRLAFVTPNFSHKAFHARGEAFLFYAKSLGASVEMLVEASAVSSKLWQIDLRLNESEALIDRLLAMTPRPTGIFVPSDMQTAMFYQLFAHRGIEPGKDIYVVSCNNETEFLSGLSPRPVTIDIQAESIGRRAVEQLLWRLKNSKVGRMSILIEPQLVSH